MLLLFALRAREPRGAIGAHDAGVLAAGDGVDPLRPGDGARKADKRTDDSAHQRCCSGSVRPSVSYSACAGFASGPSAATDTASTLTLSLFGRVRVLAFAGKSIA